MARPKTPGAKAARHVSSSRGTRVYVALLKKTDNYSGSKQQAQHKNSGKK